MGTSADSGSLALARPFLHRQVDVVVDRPLGSCHPSAGYVYELNYGYVPGVIAPDGEDLDAYLVGASGPLEEATGLCVGLIHRLDDDDKLVVALDDVAQGDDELLALVAFQEAWHRHRLLRS